MAKEGKQRLLKPVSFNLRDPEERKLLETIQEKGINFSGLVKKLLFAYLLEQKVVQQQIATQPTKNLIQETPIHSHFQTDTPDFGGMPIDWD